MVGTAAQVGRELGARQGGSWWAPGMADHVLALLSARTRL